MQSEFGFRVFAQKQAFGRSIDLTMIKWMPGINQAAKPLEFYDINPVDVGQIIQPFAAFHVTAAQELIDSLWECGLRPSEGAGSAGALAATERHLRDMQKLVFEGRNGQT